MDRELTAYLLRDDADFALVPAPPGRSWMNETYQRSAYRCLPMLIANQSGWLILNHADVRLRWDGTTGINGVMIEGKGYPLEDGAAGATSHFGCGIVSFTLPLLFRTPPGYNLLVRGPANGCKDGVAPLEGIVETDWTVATFTMNWKVTRPDTWITFERGEPICMIVPQRRAELEDFTPYLTSIDTDAELSEAVERWQHSRGRFNEELKTNSTTQKWEKHYLRGESPGGPSAPPDHQTAVHLRPFVIAEAVGDGRR